MATPRSLSVQRAVILVLTLLLFGVGELTLGRVRAAMSTIARDAAPSIIAAQEIRLSLADLDANVANYILGTTVHRDAAAQAIEQRRVHASRALVQAAENITYGDDERAPIQAMVIGLGLYLEQAAQARLLHDRGDEPRAKDTYFSATALMHSDLFTKADALDHVNKAHLDEAYKAQGLTNEGSEALATVVALALGGALLWSQIFMQRRMRRLLNVPLASATVLTVAFAAYLVTRFTDARVELKVATKDAFDSIYALSHARAIAWDANGDESRYLLDPAPARGFEGDFRKNVALLDSQPGEPARASAAAKRLLSHPGKKPDGYAGLLWDELANITFDGEGRAALDALESFHTYYAIDARIRALEEIGKHADAVELCIGTRPDESNAAFDRFDKAVEETLGINKSAFDETVAKADLELKRAEWVDPAFAIAIALLVWFGFRPRLREYSA
jgi:hypothetical protein